MELTTQALLICNLLVGLYIAFKVSRKTHPTSSKKSELTIVYFSELHEDKGYFKEESVVKVKGQLVLGELPVGQPFVISEQRFSKVNKEEINNMVEKVAAPLIKAGVAAIAA